MTAPCYVDSLLGVSLSMTAKAKGPLMSAFARIQGYDKAPFSRLRLKPRAARRPFCWESRAIPSPFDPFALKGNPSTLFKGVAFKGRPFAFSKGLSNASLCPNPRAWQGPLYLFSFEANGRQTPLLLGIKGDAFGPWPFETHPCPDGQSFDPLKRGGLQRPPLCLFKGEALTEAETASRFSAFLPLTGPVSRFGAGNGKQETGERPSNGQRGAFQTALSAQVRGPLVLAVSLALGSYLSTTLKGGFGLARCLSTAQGKTGNGAFQPALAFEAGGNAQANAKGGRR